MLIRDTCDIVKLDKGIKQGIPELKVTLTGNLILRWFQNGMKRD
jgi:hypothetical protein